MLHQAIVTVLRTWDLRCRVLGLGTKGLGFRVLGEGAI